MKIWKMLILCFIIGLVTTPAASAEKGYSDNLKNKVVLDSGDKNYIVSPWIENSSDTENLLSILLTQSISQGQTITNNVNVGSGVNSLEVDLNWGDTSDSLALSVYTPSGSKIGTYRDNSDGSVNGRVHFSIDPSQGYVQQGTWQFKTYGESVGGTQSYTFNVYKH
jgi:hypothetical protein